MGDSINIHGKEYLFDDILADDPVARMKCDTLDEAQEVIKKQEKEEKNKK